MTSLRRLHCHPLVRYPVLPKRSCSRKTATKEPSTTNLSRLVDIITTNASFHLLTPHKRTHLLLTHYLSSMSRRPNPAADKAAANQAVIKNLLKLSANRVCADCKRNKLPRWASWNLGIFICIRWVVMEGRGI